MSRGPRLGLGLHARKLWSPRNIPGGLLGLRADVVKTSGSNVTSWPDISGHGNNATLASGTNPTLTTSNAGVGGRPTVHFSGTGVLQHPLSLTSGFTVWAIANCTKGSGFQGIFGTGSCLMYAEDSASWGIYCNSAVDAGHAIETGFHSCTLLFNTASTLATFDTDGTTSTGTGTSTYSPGAVIGAGNAAGTQNMNGDLAELWVFNRIISAQEIKLLRAYASAAYRISV